MAIRYTKNGKAYEAQVIDAGYFEVDQPKCYKVAVGLGYHLVLLSDAEILA